MPKVFTSVHSVCSVRDPQIQCALDDGPRLLNTSNWKTH